MKRFLFYFLIIIFTPVLKAQNTQVLDSLLGVLKHLPPPNHTDADSSFMLTCLKIGDFYEQENPDSALYWYLSVADTITAAEHLAANPRHAGICGSALAYAGVVYHDKGDFINASYYYKKSVAIFEVLDDRKNLSTYYYNLATSFFYLSDYPEAGKYFMKGLKNAELIGNKNAVASCMTGLGNIFRYQGFYARAREYYEKSVSLFNELGDKRYLSIGITNLGIINRSLCNYEKAIEFYEKALKLAEESGFVKGISNCLNNLGLVSYNQGNYPSAIGYFERALKIAEDVGNKLNISGILINMGSILTDQGNYFRAVDVLEKALKIKDEIGDKRGFAGCLNNLGVAYADLGRFDLARDCYAKAMSIAEELLDKKGVSNSLINIGSIYLKAQRPADAKEYFEKALNIAREINDKADISLCLNNLGMVTTNLNELVTAAGYFEESLRMRAEIGARDMLASGYCSASQTMTKLHRYDLAHNMLIKSNNLTISLLSANFSILGEKDRESYLERTKEVFNEITAFNIDHGEKYDSLSGICFNNELILKGLLLKSSRSVLDAVSNSSDTTIQNVFFRLKQLREELSSLENTSHSETEKEFKKMEKEADDLEKQMIRLSSEFAGIQKLFYASWTDVKKNLRGNEAAIEFVSYEKNDSVFYGALILTAESDHPLTIKLFEESQMIKIIGEYAVNNFEYINGIYGRRDNGQTSANKLYSLIWAPLEKYLSGINTVFYAPTGILNKISFAAIGSENLLCDQYNLQQVSSTGKLIADDKFSLEKNISIALFGGIDYSYEKSDTTLTNGEKPTQYWPYLPATLAEKEAIEKQLKKSKVTVSAFSGRDASEPIFKNMFAGKNNHPTMVHIATHGFFYPDPEQLNPASESSSGLFRGLPSLDILFKDTTRKEQTEEVIFRGVRGFGNWQFVENKNPMMRAGLVMSGGNRVWYETSTGTDNDGVLTAREVSQLNMAGTELVVLSACETGLGDIKGSEGVYGLQRAFKMAGARYLVMSLWQVPDKETAEFMTLFYSKLIKLKDIRNAFNETQKEMQAKYDPYFWAAFVLVE
ncbi:MAG: hypothetical protein A2W91_14895 [Bacteroidetes bacterium GWF2_38_335]|nr:MAG: hypothetical protein A2W91_14895 [Bacteroidetes bacterium GWF2_38_335]OFY78486.1 MAG: hypothetical protein A2281_16205 [Bacteroidetes bacterium RIFOXYA12_FULL_38_20]HBS88435.1 hypothetical protein [Bacteroidales bacterium]